MQDLQFSLIVLGGLAILGVLVHGLWTIRKNNKGSDLRPESDDTPESNEQRPSIAPELDAEPELTEPTFDVEPLLSDVMVNEEVLDSTIVDGTPDPVEQHQGNADYDELGLGQVRVVDLEPVQPESMLEKEVSLTPGVVEGDELDMPEPPSSLLKDQEPTTSQAEPEVKKARVDMYPSPVTHSKVEGKRPMQEPVISDEKIVSEVKAKAEKRKEPKLDEEQMSIDFDDDIRIESEPKIQEKPKSEQAMEPEVLVLNVKSPDDKPIPGSALLPMLLTLGFKFGEQDIFHRHVNSNGKGPVLFSLANMFKPGNFDIDNLENFTTQGVSLFMMLPIEGDPHQVFNMMHNAARKIADEFGAQVLDGRRSLLTRQSLQQYVEKIREFERQRMLRK